MKINTFIIALLSLSLIFACDDKKSPTSKDTQSAGAEQPDASLDAGSESPDEGQVDLDSDIPVQMMEFDTMEIEPDPDMGPDMDD